MFGDTDYDDLFFAITDNDLPTTRMLLINRANPNVQYPLNRYPITIAQTPEIVSLLISYGANPNIIYRGGTRLHREADPEVIEALLRGGADPYVLNANGLTAIEANPRIERILNRINIEIIRGLLPDNIFDMIRDFL